MQAIFCALKLESEFNTSALCALVDQVVGAYRSTSDFLGEHVHPKQRKSDRIDDAAFSLPILAKDVVLARHEVETGLVE